MGEKQKKDGTSKHGWLTTLREAPGHWWRKGRGGLAHFWEKWGRPDYLFLVLFGLASLLTGLNVLWLIVFGDALFADRLVPGLPVNEDGSPRDLNFEEFRNLALGLVALGGSLFGLFQLANIASRTRFTRLDTDIKREAERNERFVKAATLLGDDNASISLAGVAALKRLAEEDSGAYQETVMEVLSGFIREQTNREDYVPRVKAHSPRPENLDKSHTHDSTGHSDIGKYYLSWQAPTVPVSTAFKALSSLSAISHAENGRLSQIDLTDAKLPNLSAAGAFLEGWKLDGCVLSGALLTSASFRGCRAIGIDFFQTDLFDVSFRNCRFTESTFDRSSLNRTDFTRATIWGTTFSGSFVRRCILTETDVPMDETGLLGLRAEQVWDCVWPKNFPPFCVWAPMDKSWCSTPDGNALLPREEWGYPDPFPNNWPPQQPSTEDTAQPSAE